MYTTQSGGEYSVTPCEPLTQLHFENDDRLQSNTTEIIKRKRNKIDGGQHKNIYNEISNVFHHNSIMSMRQENANCKTNNCQTDNAEAIDV